MNKHKQAVEFQTVQLNWKKSQHLPIKEKLKYLRTLGSDTGRLLDQKGKSLTPDELKICIEILKDVKASRFYDSGSVSKNLNKAIKQYVFAISGKDPKIIKKKSKTINTEGAGFVVTDLLTLSGLAIYSEKEICELINQGECFYFSTGADGEFFINIFLVDVAEPVLPENFMKKVDGVGDTAIIQCRNGMISIIGLGNLENEENKLSLHLENGNYKVTSYFKFDEKKGELIFYLVLAKTDEPAVNNLNNLFSAF